MKLLRRARGGDAPLEIKQVYVSDVQLAIVGAARVWTDARGKTHFEYLAAAQPTRDPHACSHTGEMSVRGPRGRPVTVRYTWARSSTLRLRCGDCGTELDG